MQSRILIADDHGGARSALAEIIRRSGENWDVCCEAEDGLSAVTMAAEQKPDLVILDVRMPKVDGMRAAREIRAVHPKVPILFYTILANPSLEAAALSAGFQGVIAKPDTAALMTAIRKHLPSTGSAPRQSEPSRGTAPA